MPLKNEWKLNVAACAAATQIVVEEIARRRISRRHLADMAKISLSTLEKVLSGRRPLTLSTMVRLEEALGLSLRTDQANGHDGRVAPAAPKGHGAGVAPDDLGSYARAAVKWIEGSYLTVRPSFGSANAVYAYATEISWDEEASVLTFREAERTDQAFTQFGHVSVPNQSGHVYLVTNRHGQYRLIVLSRPTISGVMHGILATLKVGRGSQLMPVATPIAFVPMKANAPTPAFGAIGPGEAAYDGYYALVQKTTDDDYAALLGLAQGRP